MKKVRLSRAFGTTPNTVYRRIEYAFTQPADAASAHGTEGPEPPKQRFSRPWLWGLVALAVVLLAVTALVVFEPFRQTADQRAASILAGEARLLDVRVRLSGAVATEKEVQATATFTAGRNCGLHYFWYDRENLPDSFLVPAGAETFYVFCALNWEQEGAVATSDLAYTQGEQPGQLTITMSGPWHADAAQNLACTVTVVRVHSDGTHTPADVSRAVVPLQVIVRKQ